MTWIDGLVTQIPAIISAVAAVAAAYAAGRSARLARTPLLGAGMWPVASFIRTADRDRHLDRAHLSPAPSTSPSRAVDPPIEYETMMKPAVTLAA